MVLHTGYFGDSFTDWYNILSCQAMRCNSLSSSLETYGAKVDQIKAEIGATVSQEAIASALKSKKYKLLTFTHVDTSTGIPESYLRFVVLTSIFSCSF